jgi:hypothetical protein
MLSTSEIDVALFVSGDFNQVLAFKSIIRKTYAE